MIRNKKDIFGKKHQPVDSIFISGIFMSFFIAFLLFTKRNKALTDRILAIWVVFIGIHLLSYYLNQLGYWERHPHLIGVTAPFPLLHGPMLYLYTLYSLRYDNKLRTIDLLHFTPVILSYAYMFKFFFFYTIEEKRMVDTGQLSAFQNFTVVLLIAFIISGLVYSILAYRLTWKHKRKLDENFSYKEGINLGWLRNCIYAIGIIFLLAALVIILRDFMHFSFSFNADYIFYSCIILFIFYIGYHGIRHQNMFTHNSNIIQYDTDKKYQKSGLKEDFVQKQHQKLLQYMDIEKPYLNPKLTLSNLAQSLNLSTNQLSQIINQQEQVNFHDFINKYRVEEFIRNASEENRFNLLALALDSGFNSKSSFNSVFKKIKGQTPSQYLSNQ